ncbi:MAG: 1-acyl-sn-glycerol-3-phosphate acyltransferase [Pseudoflavonifractor sp.]|nr:1-acyl-sn-glycerol-3-phosphate acyltransferase [Pseudoflavonifractor sp.]
MENNGNQTAENGIGDEVIKIDVGGVLRSRMPRLSRLIPRALVRKLEEIVCQDKLNRLLENNRGKRDAEFCQGVFRDLNISYDVVGEENLPPVADRRVTIMCNHPLGGLDGMVLIDYFTRRYGPGVRFVVNDLLMAVRPLAGVFVPVNKHGRQSRRSLELTRSVFEGDNPVIVFPAGLVSRLQPDGSIRDLEWQKSFVQRSIESRRDIIPVHFGGQNSPFFYKFAKKRQRLGLKFNIEMIYLPREVFNNENARFTVTIGQVIPWGKLKGGRNARAEAASIKKLVYGLPGDADGADNMRV